MNKQLQEASIKQEAAKTKRADHEAQRNLAQELLGASQLTESQILIALERKFFLNRRQAQAILTGAI